MATKAPPEFIERIATIERGSMQDEGLVELSISSTRPARSPWGDREILSHEEGAIDLSRVENGAAPLLYNHGPHPQLGKVQKGWVDGEKLRLIVKFDIEDPEVRPYWEKYRRGFLTETSVRARVHKYKVGRDEGGDYTLVTSWEFVEASFVTVPEDPTVGAGRSLYQGKMEEIPDTAMPTEQSDTQAAPPQDFEVVRSEGEKNGARNERERAAFITAMGAKYQNPELAAKLIEDGISTDLARDQFADYVFSKQVEEAAKQPVAKIGLSKQEGQKYSILRAMHAAKSGEWESAGLEREASEAIAKMLGTNNPYKTYIPGGDIGLVDAQRNIQSLGDIQRASLTTQPTNIGNLISTELRSQDLITLGREASLSARLGVPMLRGLKGVIDLPKQSAGLGFSWRSETTALTETNLAFNKATMSPKEYGGLFLMSKLANWQAEIPMGLEAFARMDFVKSLSEFLDNTLLNGLGTGNEPRGIFNTVGMQSLTPALGANGGTLNPERITELILAIKRTKLLGNSQLTILSSLRYLDYVSKLKDLDGRYVWDADRQGGITNLHPDKLFGLPTEESTFVRENFTKGTGTNLNGLLVGPFNSGSVVMGEWYGMAIDTSPHYKFDLVQDAIRLVGNLDILVRNPELFGMVNEIQIP